MNDKIQELHPKEKYEDLQVCGACENTTWFIFRRSDIGRTFSARCSECKTEGWIKMKTVKVEK